jgi:hypothetical protein
MESSPACTSALAFAAKFFALSTWYARERRLDA